MFTIFLFLLSGYSGKVIYDIISNGESLGAADIGSVALVYLVAAIYIVYIIISEFDIGINWLGAAVAGIAFALDFFPRVYYFVIPQFERIAFAEIGIILAPFVLNFVYIKLKNRTSREFLSAELEGALDCCIATVAFCAFLVYSAMYYVGSERERSPLFFMNIFHSEWKTPIRLTNIMQWPIAVKIIFIIGIAAFVILCVLRVKKSKTIKNAVTGIFQSVIVTVNVLYITHILFVILPVFGFVGTFVDVILWGIADFAIFFYPVLILLLSPKRELTDEERIEKMKRREKEYAEMAEEYQEMLRREKIDEEIDNKERSWNGFFKDDYSTNEELYRKKAIDVNDKAMADLWRSEQEKKLRKEYETKMKERDNDD